MAVVLSQGQMATRQMIMKALQATGASNENVLVQPSYVRMEHLLETNKLDNRFQISQKDLGRNARPLENRVDTTDGFVCYEFSIGVYKELILTGANERSGNAVLYYYPDQAVFPVPATAANVSEWEALLSIWNGTYGIKSNQDEIINNDSLLFNFVTPQTQFDAGVTLPSQGSFVGEQRIQFAVPMVFEGSKKNELLFTAAPGADTVNIGGNPATGRNYMVVLMRGFTIRNYAQSISVYQAFENLYNQGLMANKIVRPS